MKVLDVKVEYTGSGIYVAWGSLDNGNFFSISSDAMYEYDEDEYKAMDEEDYDAYEWENIHIVASYMPSGIGYKEVIKQVYDKCDDSDKDTFDIFKAINGDL